MTFLIISLFILWAVVGIALVKPEQFKAKNHEALSRQQLLKFGAIGTAFIVFLILIIPSDKPSQNTAVTAPVAPVKKEVAYQVVSDESKETFFRRVNIELVQRINEADLTELAHKIKAMDATNYERVLIFYRIKDEKSIAAWATTHFDPDLEVKFIGLDANRYRILLDKDRHVDGELIGEWYMNSGFAEHIIVIYKRNGQYFEKSFYNHNDGSADPEPKKLDFKQGKYSYADSDENWHFNMNKAGDLEFWGENGNSTTAKKIK